MDNWEHRARKLSARKNTKAMTKPFKKKDSSEYENKKLTKIRIKRAQKEKLSSIDAIDDIENVENI